jgi:hypothetical protein
VGEGVCIVCRYGPRASDGLSRCAVIEHRGGSGCGELADLVMEGTEDEMVLSAY